MHVCTYTYPPTLSNPSIIIVYLHMTKSPAANTSSFAVTYETLQAIPLLKDNHYKTLCYLIQYKKQNYKHCNSE